MLTPFPLHTQSSTHVFHCTELQKRFTGQRERIRSQAGQTREEISTIGELACWGMRKALIHINRGPLSLAVAHKSFPRSWQCRPRPSWGLCFAPRGTRVQVLGPGVEASLRARSPCPSFLPPAYFPLHPLSAHQNPLFFNPTCPADEL